MLFSLTQGQFLLTQNFGRVKDFVTKNVTYFIENWVLDPIKQLILAKLCPNCMILGSEKSLTQVKQL